MKKTGNRSTKKNTNGPRKKNIKKVAIAYMIAILIFVYFVYCIIQLIRRPTNVIAIEQGNLSEEESAIRICNTRGDSYTR